MLCTDWEKNWAWCS